MRSPIARGIRALANLMEWGHRRIHGPKFAPGDFVEFKRVGTIVDCATLMHKDNGQWHTREGRTFHESRIIRVIRYG